MMKLFAPVPQRLVNIASLIEAFAKEAKEAKEAKDATDATATPVCATCLRWSSLTFGIKELRIQFAVDAEIARFARCDRDGIYLNPISPEKARWDLFKYHLTRMQDRCDLPF